MICLSNNGEKTIGWDGDELRWVLCFGYVTKCNVQGKFIDKGGKVRVRGFEQLLQLCVRRCVYKHTHTHTHSSTHAKSKKEGTRILRCH